MIINYVKTAIRNLLRNKVFSIISIFGLVVGITCFLLIYIWMNYETGFDTFHKNAENLYRVNNKWPTSEYSLSCPGPTAQMLKKDYPEIVNATLYCKLEGIKVSHENDHFFTSYTFVDSTFFQMFDFSLETGNVSTVFSDPYSIVLSNKLSAKLFGNADPIGQIISIDDGYYKLKVSGVLKEIPKNSHIQIDCLISSDIGMEPLKTWHNNWPSAYVQLADNLDYHVVSDKISGAIIKHMPENVNTLSLEPFLRIHLYDRNGGGLIKYILIFSAIAFVILLIACFNFINLSTAQGLKRMKELSIRKIVGASRQRLIVQLFAETFFISILAAMMALILLEILRPLFSSFLNLELVITYGFEFFLVIISIVIFITFLAGLYPALYFSAVKPISIFRKVANVKTGFKFKGKLKSVSLRNTLIILQYILSISLIASSIVFYSQLSFLNNKDLGYNKNGIVIIPYQYTIKEKMDVLKTSLLTNPSILSITRSYPHPVIQRGNNTTVKWDGMDENIEILSFFKWIDYDFFITYDIPIVAGRYFSEGFGTDEGNFIVNEKLAKTLGFDDAVGQSIYMLISGQKYYGKIIGVVKDFINQPLYLEQQNLILWLRNSHYSHLSIKINTNNISKILTEIESKFHEVAPDFVFDYEFLENELIESYAQETQSGKLVLLAAILSITLCSLGLYGLVLFTIQKRRKEISIRKVNGASVMKIISLILSDFIIWNILALIIAVPVTYFVLQEWLGNFAFSIKISPWIYAVAFMVSILISVLAVFYHTVKAASENPVENLKYE
ncbi:MAG: hypothetical protein CVU00_05635 [Bacteroidetes bacterium HGW-Bacteroidetes-17]|jgi:putative ABC transport system permease protein|nr:MAG: hypothetical protein CVU00_05635 [Bacteroidetes bacterium HGW-Bacteroidetes-17]